MINRNKTQRLYREEDLAMRRRRSRKRAVGTRAPAPVLALPNQRWSLDFVHDQMASGRRFRVLNVVDDVTRECLVAMPDTSISGHRVARELKRSTASCAANACRPQTSDRTGSTTAPRFRDRCQYRVRTARVHRSRGKVESAHSSSRPGG
jgi:hypothetical protein